MITRDDIIRTLREKLEYFAQVPSVPAIAERIPQAEAWFDELTERLEQKI